MHDPDPVLNALLTRLENPALRAIDLGLDRVLALLDALGNPHQTLPPVIHVAGTNGKGSTLAFLAAMLHAAGYTTHRYISPHLISFRERILCAGQPIEKEPLIGYLERVSEKATAHPVTFFEATTAAAFLAFRDRKADFILLETGMGGRLDATNVIEKPLATVITPVAMDHMDFLGDTLAAIATEKAGILKPGVPAILAAQPPEALTAIRTRAREINAPLFVQGEDWDLDAERHYRSARYDVALPSPLPLPGAHQYANAATALATLERVGISPLLPQALTQARWPGRLQRLTGGALNQLCPQHALWVDGGHNAAAAEVLAEWMEGLEAPPLLICGMLARKSAVDFLAPLAPHLDSLIAVPIMGEPDSQSPDTLAAAGVRLGLRTATAATLEDALTATARLSPRPLLIAGSLYLAGEALGKQQNKEI